MLVFKNNSYFFISSCKKDHVMKVFDLILNSVNIKNKKIPTNKINIWLKKATNDLEHPLIKGKKVNFKYALQISNSPIKIKIFCSKSYEIIRSYKLYLKNNFIKYFNIKNQNIKLDFSTSKNPFNN